MSSIYGFGRIGLQSSNQFKEICSGDLSFTYDFTPLTNLVFDPVTETLSETAEGFGLVSRDYFISLTISLIDFNLIQLLDTNENFVFAGKAYSTDGKQINISSTKCLITNISPISVGQEITIEIQVLDKPAITVEG